MEVILSHIFGTSVKMTMTIMQTNIRHPIKLRTSFFFILIHLTIMNPASISPTKMTDPGLKPEP